MSAGAGLPDPDGPSRPIVDVRDLLVRRSGRAILGPLDLTIGPGERWAVLGANGSGKTTLLSVLGLTLRPTAGTVDVLGARFGRVDSRDLRRRIGLASSAIEAMLRDDLTPVDPPAYPGWCAASRRRRLGVRRSPVWDPGQ